MFERRKSQSQIHFIIHDFTAYFYSSQMLLIRLLHIFHIMQNDGLVVQKQKKQPRNKCMLFLYC